MSARESPWAATTELGDPNLLDTAFSGSDAAAVPGVAVELDHLLQVHPLAHHGLAWPPRRQ